LQAVPSKSPIRTLFIAHDAGLYGAQRSLLELVRSLDPNVVQSYVVAPRIGAFTEAVICNGIPIFVLPLSYWVVARSSIPDTRHRSYPALLQGLGKRVANICALIEQHSIDVVYTNTVTCIDGALAAHATGKPHVWHLREHVSAHGALRALFPAWCLTRPIAQLSAHVVVTSTALRSAYSAIPSDRISVVFNGVDCATFSPDPTGRAVLLKELGLSPPTKLVTIIGVINEAKGHLLFVQAAARVKRQYGDVAFLIIGGDADAYVEKVKMGVRDYGLDACFRFMGWRHDVPNILRGTDALVVASQQEPFGRTIIEAMATGVPVVATRCGGPEEVIKNGETGFLVHTKDATGMGDAIVSILLDPELGRRFGIAGRAKVEERFSNRANADAIQSILERVAVSKGCQRDAPPERPVDGRLAGAVAENECIRSHFGQGVSARR